MLLGATDEALPENVQCVKLVEKGITEVEAADLKYFTNLRQLDASENHIKEISTFSQLPELKHLVLAINGLSHLGNFPAGAFDFLEVLDVR